MFYNLFSGYKKYILIYLTCCLAIVLYMKGGWITAILDEHILRYDDYTTEFVHYKTEKFYEIKGSFVGPINRGGVVFREYHFPDVLSGHSRVFKVTVPCDIDKGLENTEDLLYAPKWNGLSVELSETTQLKPTIAEARILVMPYGASSVYGLKRNIKEHFSYIDLNKEGIHTLPLLDTYSGEDMVFFQGTYPSPNTDGWRVLPVKSEVKWVVRSKTTSSLKRLLYVVTVPIDAVLLPFEVVLLFYNMSQG